MSLLSDVLQNAFEAEALRSEVQAAEAGEEVKSRPFLKVRIWGTRGRLGLFYVVDTPKAPKPQATVAAPARPEGPGA